MLIHVCRDRCIESKDVRSDTLEEEEEALEDNVPDQPLNHNASVVPEEEHSSHCRAYWGGEGEGQGGRDRMGGEGEGQDGRDRMGGEGEGQDGRRGEG